MKLIHSINITVFVKEFDDEEKVAETLVSFLPEDFEEQKIKIEVENVKLEKEEKMNIFRLKTTKTRHNNYIIDKIKEILEKEDLERSINSVDDEGFLYIRLDKKALEKDGSAILVEHGDCYHFKILLAAYPKNKEKAIEVAKELFLTKEMK